MIETSRVFEKIKQLLDKNQIPYQLFEHEPVFTSDEAAKIRNTPKHFGAKAIIFSADPAPEPRINSFGIIRGGQVRYGAGPSPILVVVPGDKKVDTKTFKKLYNIKNLQLLTADEVKELTSLEIGAIPPFGSTMNLKTYLDKDITENEFMVFNAGSHTKSIRMNPKDFLVLENPVIGNFNI